jgi:hypothetical protein
VGDSWQQNKAEIYEIKASASGRLIDRDQKHRLQALSRDGAVRCVRAPEVLNAGQWTAVTRVKQVVRVLGIIGAAGAAWNLIHYSKFDDEFERLKAQLERAASRTNPDDRFAERTQLIAMTRDYLSHFMPSGTIADLTVAGAVYRLIADYGNGFPAD